MADQNAMSGYEEAETIDGVRLSWNVWPTTRLEAVKMVVPLAVSYTPLIRSDEVYANRCNYDPVLCRNEKCQAVLSPWCDVDYVNKMWTCPLCLTRNHFSTSYAHITADNAPLELQEASTTIEYESQTEAIGSPCFLFVIDTCLTEEKELDEIKSSISQCLALLPSDAMIGMITFGKHVYVHEIGFTMAQQQLVASKREQELTYDENGNPIETDESKTNDMFEFIHKTLVFRGDIDINNKEKMKEQNVDRIKSLLEINPQNDASILRFLQPLSECQDTIDQLLDNITRDPWKPARACRPLRCTGMAILVGISLLEAALQGYSARMIVFSGGAPTCGPGMIIEPSLAKHLRGHREIVKGKAPFYEKASNFYKDLANHAVSNAHVVDIFACCLDQVGVAEQRVLCDLTGGTLTLSDTFTTNVFSNSFAGLFFAGENGLSMVFNGEIRVRCSNQIKVSGCIGAVSRMKEQSHCVSNNEVGLGQTTKWSCGGMFPTSTFCFIFDIAASSQSGTDDANPEEYGYIQFVTTYRTSFGTNVTRVTTFGIQFANPTKKEGLDYIIQGFDQETAAVVLARLAVWKADTEFDPDLMRWLDQQLIKLVSKFAQYTKGDTDSFALPQEFELFPQFMFYLRRSQFIQVFNYSPDETAFFRSVILRENVANGLSMLQPLLHSYSTQTDEAEPVALELSSRGPDKILVLDTFFHLVIWYGRDIAAWRNDKIWETNEEYAWFHDLLQIPKQECQYRASVRYPFPNIIECDEGSGQQRFLIAKLDPPDNEMADQLANDISLGDVHSDDVSLNVFMKHLKRLAVNPP